MRDLPKNSILCGKGFVIHLYITGTEIAASCEDVHVTVTATIRGTLGITLVVIPAVRIFSDAYVMTTSKCRPIIIVAIDCIGGTGHVSLEIAISIVISQ